MLSATLQVYRISCEGLPDVAVKMQKSQYALEEIANFQATQGCRFCIQMCPVEVSLRSLLCLPDVLLLLECPSCQLCSLLHAAACF